MNKSFISKRVQQNSGSQVLKKELGLFDSTMIVIGSMIGSGIFIVSADIVRTVGSAGWLLVVWLITGVVTIVAALSYGELAGMMPRAGGQYVYLKEAYGPLAGFLYGWTLFIVIQTGTIAAVSVAFAKFTSILIPFFGDDKVFFALGPLKITTQRILAILSILFLSFLNMRGIKTGKIVQDIFTVSKVGALLCLIVFGIFIGKNADSQAINFSNFWNASWSHIKDGMVVSKESLSGLMLLPAIGVAMVGSLFSSDAWNNVTFTGAEIKNPHKTLPLSLALGTIIVTVLYLLANVSYIFVLPVTGNPDAHDIWGRGIQFASQDRVATAAVTQALGERWAMVLAFLIMISTFGCNNGLILAGARVYYAMAKDGLFFKSAGDLNRWAVPAVALLMQGLWASLLYIWFL